MKAFIVAALVISLVLCTNFFGVSRATRDTVPDVVLIGSTPCDSLMRAQLNIPPGLAIDFIRWDLSLTEENGIRGHFVLHINYGVGKPNTNGFINGGEKAITPKECYKIKWLLTLRKDPVTFAPTTYSFKRVLGSPTESTGKWSMIKGLDALYYVLVPDDKKPAITFLAGDENVIFFLDDKKQMFVGNDDFSFSLNRRISNN